MDDFKAGKAYRILFIYTKLTSGKHLDKIALANDFGVNERTIQRDLDDIRNFIGEGTLNGDLQTIVFDRKEKKYYLK